MGQSKYRIFELSARAVMSYAAQENGQWHFALDRAATEKCKRVSALHNVLFHYAPLSIYLKKDIAILHPSQLVFVMIITYLGKM